MTINYLPPMETLQAFAKTAIDKVGGVDSWGLLHLIVHEIMLNNNKSEIAEYMRSITKKEEDAVKIAHIVAFGLGVGAVLGVTLPGGEVKLDYP